MIILYQIAFVNKFTYRKFLLHNFRTSYSVFAFKRLCDKLNYSNIQEIEKACTKWRSFKLRTEEDMNNTVSILERFHIDPKSALKYPGIYASHPYNVDNYGSIWLECGVNTLDALHIAKYHSFTKMTIEQLKKKNILPPNVKLDEKLLDVLDENTMMKSLPKPLFTNETTLYELRLILIRTYLITKLSISEDQVDRMLKNYSSIRNKPLGDLREMLTLLREELQMTEAKIARNGFVFGCYPPNLKGMLEHKRTLSGMDIRWVLQYTPTLMRINYNTLGDVEKVLVKHGIPIYAQRHCFLVYSLSPTTVDERLTEIMNYPEFKVLQFHPRFLFLVLHKNKAVNRLMKLRSLNKKCLNLIHFINAEKGFDNFVNSLGDQTYCIDASFEITKVLYPALKLRAEKMSVNGASNTKLKNNFNSYEQDLKDICATDSLGQVKRKRLNQHSFAALNKFVVESLKKNMYWNNIPTSTILETLAWLMKRFSQEDICDNLVILLYPQSKIEKQLKILEEIRSNNHSNLAEFTGHTQKYLESLQVIDVRLINNSHILSLVVYGIERECYFTGGGIWCNDEIPKEAQEKCQHLSAQYA